MLLSVTHFWEFQSRFFFSIFFLDFSPYDVTPKNCMCVRRLDSEINDSYNLKL